MGDSPTISPLRLRHGSPPDELACLRLSAVEYADGAETRVLEHVRAASDLSSLSQELEGRAGDFVERYHLSRSRANIVRALDLSMSARVLEVGAGCGAITRYLGEECALVDALEPVVARAQVAVERTADLESVRVFAGELDDVPGEAFYDVVLFCGVLEYVGEGSADHAPYVATLAAARERLAPGGRIVIAIENQLGVKYFAGAPEDHSGRVFDGIEGYPNGCRARTWSRRELGDICAGAGLDASFMHAFPDYKMTRVVMSDALMADPRTQGAVVGIPSFPSDTYPETERWQLSDERRLWRSLVRAGVGQHHANSFLVIAAPRGDVTPPLVEWPESRMVRFFNTRHRATRFATVVSVVRDADGELDVRRGRLQDLDPSADGLVAHRVGPEDYVDGTSLLDVVSADPGRRPELLRTWRDLVRSAHDERGGDQGWLVDAVPGNVIVDGHGALHLVDQEWVWKGLGNVDMVVRRGLLLFAVDLARMAPPGATGTAGTIASELAEELGVGGGWLDAAIGFEAEFQCLVNGGGPDGHEERRDAVERDLRGLLTLSVVDLVQTGFRLTGPADLDLGARLRHMIDRDREHVQMVSALTRRVETLDHEHAGLSRDLAEMTARCDELTRLYRETAIRYDQAVNSRGWRILEGLRRLKPGRRG